MLGSGGRQLHVGQHVLMPTGGIQWMRGNVTRLPENMSSAGASVTVLRRPCVGAGVPNSIAEA